MRSFVLLCVCVFAAAADPTSDGLRAVFSAIGGLNACNEPCLEPDLIFAARELLFFKDTIQNFKDMCHTYENASLCVSAKELQCMQTSSFATDASGIEDFCDDKDKKIQPQMTCIQNNVDRILDDCNAQCWFTPALTKLISQDPSSDTNNAQSISDEDFNNVCPATSCFTSCLASQIDSSCPKAGSEIMTAILRPFFIDAGLMAMSDSEMVAASMESVPDSCKPFADVDALIQMARGTYQVDAAAMDAMISTLSATLPSSSSTPSTTTTTTASSASFRAGPRRPVGFPRRGFGGGGRFGHFGGHFFGHGGRFGFHH